jgi:ribosomal protein L27
MAINNHLTEGRRPFRFQAVFTGAMSGNVVLTGNIVLTRRSAQWLKLDANGVNRDVTLPVVEDGLFFWIVNSAAAAFNLVVKNPAGATVVTINQNEEAVVCCDAAGWYLHRVATIALS